MKPTRWLLAVFLLLLTACAGAGGANSPTPPTANAASPQPVTDAHPDAATAEDAVGPPQADNTVPAGALSIVSLGDSLTRGDGDDSGIGGYPPRLKILVDALRPGSQMLNLGRSGWAAIDLINGINGERPQLDEALAAHPQLVTVWIGSNDLWYLYEYGPDPMTAEAEQTDLQAYESSIDTILSRLTQSGAKVFVALLDDQSKRPVVVNPPNPAEPAFSAISADDLARMSVHGKTYNEIIRRKAAQYGAETVDFYDTDIFTNPATLYDDGNHPNTAGYEKITQIWFAALEPYLK